jgi:hypothetical protein
MLWCYVINSDQNQASGSQVVGWLHKNTRCVIIIMFTAPDEKCIEYKSWISFLSVTLIPNTFRFDTYDTYERWVPDSHRHACSLHMKCALFPPEHTKTWNVPTNFSQILKHYVRFEVFTAVTMKNAVFWDVAPCRSCVNRLIGLQSAATCSRWFLTRGFLYSENGGDTFLRNVGLHNIYTAPHPRRRHSSLKH